MGPVFGSRWFRVGLVALLAVGITAVMGMLLAHSDIPFRSYDLCGTRMYEFPIPWVDSTNYASGIGSFQTHQCGIGTSLTSYNWRIFGLDSSLLAGVGYVILFMRRIQHNELFTALAASYIGSFAIVSLYYVDPGMMPFADSFWSIVRNSGFGPWADTITLFVEWFIMAVLAYDAFLLAGMLGNILRHNQAYRTNVEQDRSASFLTVIGSPSQRQFAWPRDLNIR